jgi:hypothetical protein
MLLPCLAEFKGQQINIFFENFDFLRSTRIKLLSQQKEVQ